MHAGQLSPTLPTTLSISHFLLHQSRWSFVVSHPRAEPGPQCSLHHCLESSFKRVGWPGNGSALDRTLTARASVSLHFHQLSAALGLSGGTEQWCPKRWPAGEKVTTSRQETCTCPGSQHFWIPTFLLSSY